jgi:hypothetical protein
MPKVSSFYGIIIMMFFKEHNPPHFHVKYGEFKAQIRISDLGIIEGKLPARTLGLVVEWASIHKEELMNNWNRARNNEKILDIEPLL